MTTNPNPNEIYNNPAAGDLERMLAATAVQLHRIAQALDAANAKPPECVHGQRIRKTGTNDRGDWVGWFCPLPQDRKDERCTPVFEDTP